MTDPIFAAIDKHRRARRLHVADVADGDYGGEACDAETVAWDALIATRPTTVEGLAVVLSYIAAWQGEDDGACAHAGDLLTAIRSAAASAEILGSGSKAA